MPYMRMTPDPEWATQQVDPFPVSWARRLLDKWQGLRWQDRAAANLELLRRSKLLRQSWRAGVQPDANDADLCQRATDAAREAKRRIGHVLAKVTGWARELVALLEVGAWMVEMDLGDLWRGLRRKHGHAGSLARVQCEKWWRLVLRRMQARTCEAVAIDLRMVHKRGECYVSNDGVRARRGQLARNAGILSRTHAVNDAGQDYTLADLAAKGPANAEIRRAELMTRIAGFELIARDCGHVADFITVTCPSRMHAMRSAGTWRTEPNPRYDGTKPNEAQAYLSGQWARLRAWWGRRQVLPYGFRITEPNHDGTPHWHLLVFYPADQADKVREGLRRYFLLNDSATERGAEKHRITVERIDPARGSAAGYIAKYVSKNIDGYRVEKDLYGNEAIEASARVQAWAARWRIRQFQQVGGPPVTVWRELRRINPDTLRGDECDTIEAAIAACNTSHQAREALTDEGQRHTAALGWAQYVKLQGGATGRAGRRVLLLREETGELGRYGEPTAPKPVGIMAMGHTEQWVQMALMPGGGFSKKRDAATIVQSERSEWIVVPRASIDQARELVKARGEAARPWTRVNNCTHGQGGGVFDVHPEALFGPVRQVRPKVGRVFNWAKKPPPHENPS
jgi:hypothetical protein